VLRISVECDQDGFSFVLEGRLVGPWVDELRTVWQELAGNQPGAQLTVDLCGLTAMDTGGQRLLDELLQRGATLRCSDVMNQYLVEQMTIARGTVQEACRPCRRFSEEDSRVLPTETKLAS
jgi:ABC-type transporter Mla MlaB component